jgi:hypothetical protein
MFYHISSKLKGKGKSNKGEGSSFSSQAQSDTSASFFVVIVSLPFIFIYTCSFEFIVFTCRAQRPLGSDRSRFFGCCMARSSTRLRCSTWPKRRRLTWRRRLTQRRTSCPWMTVRRRRVHHREETSSSRSNIG